MSKNKKMILMISLIVVMIIAIAISLTIYLYPKNKYTLEFVQELLSSEKDISNVKVSVQTRENDNVIYDETYIKDNYVYSISKDASDREISEYFYNPNEHKKYNVLITEKRILALLMPDAIEEPSETSNFLNLSKSSEIKYQYIGKEKIDEKECIEVCLTNESYDKKIKDYYYIDLDSNYIIKRETYEGTDFENLEKTYEITYTYSYGVVTDEDIVKFDLNKYEGYMIL